MYSPAGSALVMILEEESVSRQAPLSPNNKTTELGARKPGHVLKHNSSEAENLLGTMHEWTPGRTRRRISESWIRLRYFMENIKSLYFSHFIICHTFVKI